ncbi:MAG TPA: PDZ domain-containing protein [Pirellulales bacterium]|nr:PDZ domain-containing protein [Pirellulales bacterium]
MTRPLRLASLLGGWLWANGIVGIAYAQYQDTDAPDSRMFNSNNRTQSNISNQGTGFSPDQFGLYGAYYNQSIINQNNRYLGNANGAFGAGSARARAQARVSGLPNRGLPLNSPRLAIDLMPRRARRAPPVEALGMTLKESDGRLLVDQVRENSAMATAGFKAGDEIETVKGKQVSTVAEFQRALGTLIVGEEVPIVIVRGGQSETLKWAPQDADLNVPGNEPPASLPPGGETGEGTSEVNFIAAAQLGRGQRGQPFLGVRPNAKQSAEVIIETVMPGSPADQAGLRPGDRVYSVSGVKLRSPQELGQVIARSLPGSPVYLYIGRAVDPVPGESEPRAEMPAPAETLPGETAPADRAAPPAGSANPAAPQPAAPASPAR